jgi:hypothetical protein
MEMTPIFLIQGRQASPKLGTALPQMVLLFSQSKLKMVKIVGTTFAVPTEMEKNLLLIFVFLQHL